jgi:hypothetical protein
MVTLIIFIPVKYSSAQMNQTLLGWEDEKKLMILNRYQSFGGIFYDRGLFRFTTPRFTDEHDLDLITYNFTATEHYDWYYNKENGFRTYMGSFNLGQFLHGVELRNSISLSDRLTFPIRFVKRYDMRQDRSLVFLTLNYKLSENQNIGLSHTLNETKPDMDATFYYKYGDLRTGGIQLEITFLDWANNSAYKLGQRRGTQTPELRRYERKPYMLSLKANSPTYRNFRAEAVAGIQTPLTAIAESMPEEYPGISFRDKDAAKYAGILLEYALPRLTLGTTFRHSYTRFSRINIDNLSEPVDYGNRQIQNSFGGFIGASYGRFYTQNWIWRNYNLDVQTDQYETRMVDGFEVYPFDFREFRWQLQFRLGYNPDASGFTTSIQFSSDYRRPTENFNIYDDVYSRGYPYRIFYLQTLRLKNERLTYQFGYRFNQKAHIELGFSIDLDGDVIGTYWDTPFTEEKSRFDGGFGRFVINF